MEETAIQNEINVNVPDLESLLDASPDVICSFDREGQFTYVSSACTNVLGFTAQELIGRKYIDFVVQADREKTTLIAEAIMNGEIVSNFENRYRTKNGAIKPILWSAKWDTNKEQMYCVAKDATKNLLREQKAIDYQDQLYKAYRLSKIGWWEWNFQDENYIASNELYEIYGIDKQIYPCFTKEVYLSFVHPHDKKKVIDILQRLTTETELSYAHHVLKPSGKIIYIKHYIKVERGDDGALLRIHGITKDITEKKLARLKAKKANQKIATILESIKDGFIALDKEWRVVYWNHKSELLLGKKREEVLGKSIWEIYKDALQLKFYSEYRRAISEQAPVHFEEFLQSLNLWFEVSAYPSRAGLSIYFKDITHRRQREEELKISNERFEFVSLATSDIIWDWNLETGATFVNEAFTRTYGYKVNQSGTFKIWEDNLHPDDKLRVLQSQKLAIENPLNFYWKAQYRFIKSDGSTVYLSDKAFINRNESGKAVRMVGAVRDITHIKKLKEQEQLARNHYYLLFEDSPVPKWIFEEETLKFVDVNKAATEQYGYSKSEFLNMTILDIRPESERVRILQILKEKKGKSNIRFKGIIKHVKKNGAVVYAEITSHAYKQNSKVFIVIVANDVTEKLEAQKELGRAIIQTQEKERSLVGKELHDNVNQMLTTAKLYIENSDIYPEQRDVFLKKGADIIQKSINEIRSLSHTLITPTLCDIGFEETIQELTSYYKELKLFAITVDYGLAKDVVDRDLKLSIYRILQELFSNTVKYAQASEVQLTLQNNRSFIRIVYSDNGKGFQPGEAKKGIGITNIKSRVAVHNGKIRIKSNIGEGTKALVVFPI